MTTPPPNEIEAFRAQELLLKRATEGLDDHEAAELVALGADQDLGFELAAAAIDLATLQVEDLPAGVADKVLVAAGVRSTPLPSTLAGVAMPARPLGAPAPSTAPAVGDTSTYVPEDYANIAPVDELANARAKRSPSRGVAVAYVAAAACLALAIGAVLWARQQTPRVITKEVDRVVLPTTASPGEARATLLATASDVTTLVWTATADEAARGARGDVVWSAARQKGFMRFVGLAPNDPKVLQYQLWIFDKDRDQAFPVDGGVFDVTTGEVIVPISAKLPVGAPVLFAVTIEKPGGVVVSKRERIVVTAAPPA